MKKKSVRKEPKYKGPTLIDRLPKNKVEHMELMIRLTEKAIGNSTSDNGLNAQLERMKMELSELRKNNL